jgi:hypothetical protein
MPPGLFLVPKQRIPLTNTAEAKFLKPKTFFEKLEAGYSKLSGVCHALHLKKIHRVTLIE